MKKLEALKKELENIMNDSSIDFVNDYAIENNSYLCDAFTEFSDNRVSVYYSDQREFYFNNRELCNDALIEFGYDLNDFIKEGYDLDDLICKAGAVGEYQKNYCELSEDEEEIKKLLVINYLIENEITTIDEETINNIINEDIEIINDLKDLIDEELEEQKKDLIESQKAEC